MVIDNVIRHEYLIQQLKQKKVDFRTYVKPITVTKSVYKYNKINLLHFTHNITCEMSPFACAYLIVLISISLLNNYNVDCANLKLPKFVKQCHLTGSHDELKKCMQENAVILKPRLGPGIPEMNIPGLDPFHLERAVIDAPNIRLEFDNIVLTGVSNCEVPNAEIDDNNTRLIMDLVSEVLYVEAAYAIKGKLLILELDSKGDVKGNFSNVSAHLELNGKKRISKGQTFLDFNDDKMNSIELVLKAKPRLQLTNLFANNEELSRTTQQVIDDNIDEIIEEFLPMAMKIIGSSAFEVIKQVFNTFSVEDLFLP